MLKANKTANRVAKNTIILYTQMAITVVMSLYTTRLVLAALGTEDFGIFNVVGGAIAMLMFLSAAMTSASQRFMSFSSGEGDITKQRQIFNISLKMHILIALIIVVLLEILGFFLFDGILNIDHDRIETAKFIYQCLIVSTFFTVLAVPYDAVVNAHENMMFVAILRIIEVLLKLSIAIFITYAIVDKLYLYGLLMALIPIILFFIRQFYGHRKYDEVVIDFKKYKQKALFKEMFGFAGWSFLGTSSSMIANYGQGIVVNMFYGTTVNAAQGISSQVSGQLGTFANIMLKALNPVLAKSEGAGDRSLMRKASLLGSKLSFFLLVFFYVPVMIEMPYIFNVWLKEVPEYAIIFCRLLLLKNLIEQIFVTLNSSIAAVGDIKQFQKTTSGLNFLPLIATYLFFTYGVEPYIMYVIFIVYALIKGAFILYYAKIKCGFSISDFLRKILFRCFLVFIITSFFGIIPFILIEDDSLYRLSLVASSSVVAFLISSFLIGFERYERNMIKGIIISVKNKL